jgi:hypothetical protein
MHMSKMWIGITAGLLMGALTGCEQQSTTQPTNSDAPKPAEQAKTDELPAELFASDDPGEARGVGELKADESATGEVVVRGRIGGRVDPFLDDAAVFFLADTSMKTCDELHEDGCPTPWDYCCEPKDSLMAKLATVQVLGADGKPLKVDIKGTHGLDPATFVKIVGDVMERPNTSMLVINARRIYVEPDEG